MEAYRRRPLPLDGKRPSQTGSILLLLELKPVGDHGDKFTVCRFSLGVGHGVAKVFLQRFQIAAVPSHFNGVADGRAPPGWLWCRTAWPLPDKGLWSRR